MQNMKLSKISRYLDLFFSDDFEKDCNIPTENKDTLPLNNHHDDIFDDYIHDNEKHYKERNKLMPRYMTGKNTYEGHKIEKKFGLYSNDEFDSNSYYLSSEQYSSSRFLSEYFSTKSKIKEMYKNESYRNKKTKKIKRENNEIKHTKHKSNQKKYGDRKIRTTVSYEKIKILEHLFPFIEKRLAYKGTLINLKDVAKIVNLGYSTILHKYKDYRRKGAVYKGLLLKSKDIKRKYHKSLVIEKYIKDALKERKFRTAKYLAQYISYKYKIKVNRSIVSRHLNEMHRYRECYDLAAWVESEYKQDYGISGECMVSLREFSKTFFGLKNENFQFFYITVIRLYLVEGKLVNKVPKETMAMNFVNLVVTATENNLLYYIPNALAEDYYTSKQSFSYTNKYPAYRALYDELTSRIEYGQEYIESCQDPVYVIFPYEDKHRYFVYRQKIMKKLLNQKINVLTIPPKLNSHKINFIQKWFFRHVFYSLQEYSYLDFSECREVMMKTMNEEQGTLSEFALDMIHAIRKVQ